MIKSTELRDGNLFMDSDGTWAYFAGFWVRSDGIILRDSGNNTYKELEVFPIPLDEGILIKCGFKEDVPNEIGDIYCKHYHNKNNFYISQWVHDKSLVGFEKKGMWYVGEYIEVPSLHWLQNWYYFNNGGKELEINLP